MLFKATFYRYNPQRMYCGYNAEREVEADSIEEATKKAKEFEDLVNTGMLSLINVEPQ